MLILKTYPFYFVSIRNNYPMNSSDEDNVNPKTDTLHSLHPTSDTSIIIYVETTSKLIDWSTASQKGQSFRVASIQLKEFPFNAGFVKDGHQLILGPAKGIFLWQLQLSPTGLTNSLPIKTITDEILLYGSYKRKKVTWKTPRPQEITPLPPS